MSWNRYAKHTKWYSVWSGLYSQIPQGDIPTDVLIAGDLSKHGPKRRIGASYLMQANDVFSPGIAPVLKTRPGFTNVRSTAINANGIFTGMCHQGEIADNFLMWVSIAGVSHKPYQDSANPPVAIAGGTDFTIGGTDLVSWAHFLDSGAVKGTVFCSRSQDLPQFINGTPTRSNYPVSGTGLTSLKPKYVEVFGQRALYGDVNFDGTLFDDRVYWSDIRNGQSITDPTTQFFSFETTEKDRVRAIRKFSDICMVGKLNNVFMLALTPNAALPFAIQEVPAGRYKGPWSHNAVIEADQRIWWIGQTSIFSLDQSENIRDWGDPIRPTIAGLNDAQRQYAVAGYDSVNDLIIFCVANGSSTTNNLAIALNIKTGALYLWTISRNALTQRLVSSDNRMIGGGYVGTFYNEVTGTSGAADDATSVIDADVFTPRFWLGAYGGDKKIPGYFISVDAQATESITTQYRLNYDTAWTTPAESPISVASSDTVKFVHVDAIAERIQIRIRNNTLNQAFSVKAVGIPALPLKYAYA